MVRKTLFGAPHCDRWLLVYAWAGGKVSFTEVPPFCNRPEDANLGRYFWGLNREWLVSGQTLSLNIPILVVIKISKRFRLLVPNHRLTCDHCSSLLAWVCFWRPLRQAWVGENHFWSHFFDRVKSKGFLVAIPIGIDRIATISTQHRSQYWFLLLNDFQNIAPKLIKPHSWCVAYWCCGYCF